MTSTPERWSRIKAIFDAAIAVAAPTRRALVERACAGDEELRAEVMALLAGHDDAAALVETPAELLDLAETSDADLLGRAFGGYTIRSRLGSGAMGRVFLAHDAKLNRFVALKLLPARFSADADRLRRFHAEARAASTLNHPNILIVHDFGEAEGRPFIVTEYVEGRTLRQRIDEGPIPEREAIAIATQIAGALAAAHARGIVHRDVKPENVMIRPDGYVKVLDFGLAKLTSARTGVAPDADALVSTMPGMVVGTPRYMSPEQARGHELDARSDVWSLGVILYEMLAGQPPFAGATPSEVMGAILFVEPAPLNERAPGTPPRIAEIVATALQRHAANRFASAEEMHRRLAAAHDQAGAGIPRRRGLAWIAAAAVVLAASAAGLRWLQTRPPAASVATLAVMPFHALAGADDDHLGIGMTDTLITQLGRVGRFVVRPTLAVVRYANTAVDPVQAGLDLKVDLVLAGNLQRSGQKLRVNVRLVDVASKAQLWSQTFDEPFTDIFAVQDSIAQRVVESLRMDLTRDERARLTRRATSDHVAYELYATGRYYWNRRTAVDLEKSITYLNQAIARDPSYALAHAALGDAYLILGNLGYLAPREAYPQAKAAAARAIELDPELAEPRITRAYASYLYDWDPDAAEREFKTALDLNPNYAAGRQWYSIYLIGRGRSAEAFEEVNRAVAVDPTSLIVNATIAWLHYFNRDYDRAIESSRRTLELDPHFRTSHHYLGLAYLQKQRYDDAIAELRLASDIEGYSGGLPLAPLASAMARAGRPADARRLLATLDGIDQRQYVSPWIKAVALGALGDRDEAFRALEAAYTERHPWLVLMAVEPLLDPLRDDPRFNDLMNRTGLFTSK